ncbi:alpha/beta hydrolase family protein [Dokdonella sp.]|uniref:alpha/beta hydrolase family protein n=1 Tax=Dokdonella sp. TaxID=2291710 RepID=UPI0035288C29
MRRTGFAIRVGSERGSAACLILAVVCLLASPAALAAGMYPVDPGQSLQLQADEGLLVVVLDSSVALDVVVMRKQHSIASSAVLRRAGPGRSFQLFRVAAGRYAWDSLRTQAGQTFKLEDNPEFHFVVPAGQVAYPGELVFDPAGSGSAHIYTVNHGLAAIDWIESEHAAVYARYPFVYSGHYTDPFPEFYRGLRAQATARTRPHAAFRAPPQPGPLPLPIDRLWQAERQIRTSVSPNGRLLAVQTREPDADQWVVSMVDLEAGERQPLTTSEFEFESLNWSGNETLLLSFLDASGTPGVSIFHVATEASGRHRYTELDFRRKGRVLDVLPDEPRYILFASSGRGGRLLVHKLDVSRQDSLSQFRADPADRINVGLKDERWWFTDGSGQLSVAVVIRDGAGVLMNRQGDRFVEFFRMTPGTGFQPSALSADGKSMIGLSELDRGQHELVEFDIASQRISRTLFRKPGVDIVEPLFDARLNPIGAQYYEGGQLVSEYFDRHDRERAEVIGKAFPGRSVSVIDQSEDSSQLILRVDGPGSPPQIHHLDTRSGKAALIEESMPWLAQYPFAPTKVLTVRGTDGLQIDAFLTLPSGAAPRPLVVMPHGGPVGVSDHLHFDRQVQFLASLGYAVLRVNYRGSDGYGRAFREAGHHQFGGLIEDDIDAALKQALAQYPLDPNRMCTLGFSYGGYSALIAVARDPDRYRCAISVSGVTDRLLFFTASDSGRTRQGRIRLETIIGDPNTQLEQMIETSPLYRHADIRVPVMLVHGKQDPRVDFEHALRLQRLLDLDGRPPVGLVFENAGHGFEDEQEFEALWSGIAGFLSENLKSGAE